MQFYRQLYFCSSKLVPVISVNNAPANISGCYVTKFFKLSICCIIQPNVLVYKRGKIKRMKGIQNLVAQWCGNVYNNFSYMVKCLMRYLHTLRIRLIYKQTNLDMLKGTLCHHLNICHKITSRDNGLLSPFCQG